MTLHFKQLSFFFLLSVYLCPAITLAQASFTATISPRIIGKDETTELRLMIENATKVDQIIPPSLKNFNILSGPNHESGLETNNGITRQYIGITYLLQPKTAGRFIIDRSIAKADGKILKSNPVTVAVTNTPSAGNRGNTPSPFRGYSPFSDPADQSSYNDYILKKGENIADKINKNIFIKVDISKNTCYVGEPVVVTYKLYTRLKSESSILKSPSFNGFSVIDLVQPGSTYNIEKLNGREYNVYSLRKSQLYPLQAGIVELEIAEVENNIHFIKEEFLHRQYNVPDDIFRDWAQTAIPAEGMHDEKVTIQNKPAFITVKDLPAQDKPATFRGAVGSFDITADVDETRFTTDDAGKLNLMVSGEGNMTLINAPGIEWPDGVESFESSSKEQLNKLTVPVSGIKYFEYPFVIAKPGKYIIPSVSLVFFNAKESRYKTVSTKPITINVQRGIGKPATVLNKTNEVNSSERFFEMLFTHRWMIVLPVALFIIAGLLLWLKKEKKLAAQQGLQKNAEKIMTGAEIAPVSFKPLLLTEERLAGPDTRGFYEALNNDLRKFLADKFQLPFSAINKKRIAEEADKNGTDVITSLQIQQLLDDIEWQLYTPYADTDKIQDLYNRADAVIHSLNGATR